MFEFLKQLVKDEPKQVNNPSKDQAQKDAGRMNAHFSKIRQDHSRFVAEFRHKEETLKAKKLAVGVAFKEGIPTSWVERAKLDLEIAEVRSQRHEFVKNVNVKLDTLNKIYVDTALANLKDSLAEQNLSRIYYDSLEKARQQFEELMDDVQFQSNDDSVPLRMLTKDERTKLFESDKFSLR